MFADEMFPLVHTLGSNKHPVWCVRPGLRHRPLLAQPVWALAVCRCVPSLCGQGYKWGFVNWTTGSNWLGSMLLYWKMLGST